MSELPTQIFDRPTSMGGTVAWTDTPHTYPPFVGDAEALADALSTAVRGEVRFDSGSRALYATDSSNYRQVPIGVVIPRDVEDLVTAVSVCRRFGAPIAHRGGGTSLAGQSCNAAVIIDCSKYVNKIIAVDADRKIARVQPGVRHDQLTDFTEREYGLTFGPDPSTHKYCTFGGMIGNNACGVHSEMAGRTENNVEELEILTYDGLRMRVGPTSEEALEQLIQAGGRRGEIYRGLRGLRDRYADLIRARFPDIPRCISGYNLPELLPENGFNVARALVGKDTLAIADGFSCREQIHQATDRHALHLAEVLHLALHAGDGRAAAYPEQPYVEQLRYATNGATDGQTPVNGQAGGR